MAAVKKEVTTVQKNTEAFVEAVKSILNMRKIPCSSSMGWNYWKIQVPKYHIPSCDVNVQWFDDRVETVTTSVADPGRYLTDPDPADRKNGSG